MTLQLGPITVYIPVNTMNTQGHWKRDTSYTDQEWLEFHIVKALYDANVIQRGEFDEIPY